MSTEEKKFIAIGDKIKDSPEGEGVVEDITPAGHLKVNGKLVGWAIREDGLRYNPLGIGAQGTDLHVERDTPKGESVQPLTTGNTAPLVPAAPVAAPTPAPAPVASPTLAAQAPAAAPTGTALPPAGTQAPAAVATAQQPATPSGQLS